MLRMSRHDNDGLPRWGGGYVADGGEIKGGESIVNQHAAIYILGRMWASQANNRYKYPWA